MPTYKAQAHHCQYCVKLADANVEALRQYISSASEWFTIYPSSSIVNGEL